MTVLPSPKPFASAGCTADDEPLPIARYLEASVQLITTLSLLVNCHSPHLEGGIQHFKVANRDVSIFLRDCRESPDSRQINIFVSYE
jgi:hypothetical protein